ncbi:MAG: KR domain-containing protein, partial [candidate division Zixibacteria bacterium]|nr:KR domain-containing protein [candidate division Zixibacteria bacterium]
IWIAPYNSLKPVEYKTLIAEQEKGVILLFKMIKATLSLGYGSKDLGLSIITVTAQSVFKDDPINPGHASVHGLVGSMAKEYPNWRVRLVDLESTNDLNYTDIFTIPSDPSGNALFYRDMRWHKEELVPVGDFKTEQSLYKDNGVYVVIGGAGGIGAVWSEYMIRSYKARIIWVGRREKDDEIETKIKSVGTPEPLYISADA